MPQPFVAIARFDAQGGRLCGVGGLSLPPGAPLPAWFTQVQGGAALVLGRTADGLPLAAAPAENGGVLAAELPPTVGIANEVLPDMLEPGGAVWLMDDTPERDRLPRRDREQSSHAEDHGHAQGRAA